MDYITIAIVGICTIPFFYVLTYVAALAWHKVKLKYHQSILKLLEPSINEP